MNRLLTLLVIIPWAAAQPNYCIDGLFACDNGDCIPNEWLCDNDNDCGDFSDEKPDNCIGSDTGCRPDQSQCNNGECFPGSYKCDHITDCFDGSDEHHCPCTSDSSFKCDDGECIAKRWVCDNHFDCLDMSDERNCTKINDVNCSNGSDQSNCVDLDTSSIITPPKAAKKRRALRALIKRSAK